MEQLMRAKGKKAQFGVKDTYSSSEMSPLKIF